MINNKFSKSALYKSLIFLSFTILFHSCGNNEYVPKPRSYFKISFPEKKYKIFDSIYPYTFEYPEYSSVSQRPGKPNYLNVDFPAFKGTLYLSYKKVSTDSSLYQYFEDSRNFVNKHISKADNIETVGVNIDSNRVYGFKYYISGVGVASTYQFSLTDSLSHFLRGSLYFNVAPNNDSLLPVIDFISKDIDYLISSLHWKSK